MNLKLFCVACLTPLSMALCAQKVFEMERYGLVPDKKKDMSVKLQKAIEKIRKEVKPGEEYILRFKSGRYNFYPENAAKKTYYVSNHDQPNPKNIGIVLEDLSNMTLDGGGSKFVFHGTMLPLALVNSTNCTLENFSIDFDNPHITQIEIVKNEGKGGMTFRVAPWVQYKISKDTVFHAYGSDWDLAPSSGIAFEKDTKHILYNTGDLFYSTKGVKEVGDRLLHAPLWNDARLKEGTVIAMRAWNRPTPGVFLSHNTNTTLKKVTVHYAQGMGLIAQLCDNIYMDGFNVCLDSTSNRYFTTQADATHFSQCKGKITSVNGLYEGMMDDAINVHGIYLKIMERLDDHTLRARYMHDQSWGFDWGYEGDTVTFIRTQTMEYLDGVNRIAEITPLDGKNGIGMREFKIRFEQPVPAEVDGKTSFGIENLTWTPEVYFAGNTIQNNRARGSLFSTPKKTLVENNQFLNTSGSAILLCGDCNGWYETGMCKDVTIRNNKFVNALTSMYQFTNAVISIYPEIPDLKNQVKYFHKGSVLIENNEFHMFDAPVLYAKSIQGLVFQNNKIIQNNDYKPFHWNKQRFFLEKVDQVKIQD
jgi:hypothetical protein